MFHRDSFDPNSLIVLKRAVPSTLLLLGAFVRLRSGGPVGVIESLDEDDRARVVWLTSPPCRRVISDLCLMSVSSACEPSRSGGAPSPA